MSLRLMKERIKVSGLSPREEMIRDGQNLLLEELEHDSSYSPTLFFYDPVNRTDDRIARLRVYGRKYSSLNGNYMSFTTTYDNPVKIGDYLHDTKDDSYWLVYNSFNVDDIHYEGKLIQCNYLLNWQLSNGEIVERWANIVSASKYDVGEKGSQTIIMSTNNFTILIGFCEEGFELEEKRVFIDKSHNPRKVFKITRGDDVLYDCGTSGSLLSFIADKTEYNPVLDRPDIKICDYIDNFVEDKPYIPTEPTDKENFVIATIKGIKNLKVGISRTCYAVITDNNGNELEWDNQIYGWSLVGNTNIKQTVIDNKLKLLVEDEGCIGNSFLIQVIKLDENKIIGETNVSVVEIV